MYSIKQTGSNTAIGLRKGAYVIDMWVNKGEGYDRDDMEVDACGISDSSGDFTRLGAEAI